MIALALLAAGLFVVGLIATEPARAERRAQREADERADERLFWALVKA